IGWNAKFTICMGLSLKAIPTCAGFSCRRNSPHSPCARTTRYGDAASATIFRQLREQKVKSEIRSSKPETNSKVQRRNFKTTTYRVWDIRIWGFVIVSDFEFRISDLRFAMPLDLLEAAAPEGAEKEYFWTLK